MFFLVRRVVSLKLDPKNHPLPGDTLVRGTWDGVRASLNYPGSSALDRVMNAGWFVCVLLAPQPLARWLVQMLYYPEKRGGLNAVLRVLAWRRRAVRAPYEAPARG
jgi:hypothetical protein